MRARGAYDNFRQKRGRQKKKSVEECSRAMYNKCAMVRMFVIL